MVNKRFIFNYQAPSKRRRCSSRSATLVRKAASGAANQNLDQVTKSRDRFSCVSGELGALQRTMMTTLKIATIAAGLLVGGTSLAMAQYGGWYLGYGYAAARRPCEFCGQ